MSDKSTKNFLIGNGCMLLAAIFWGFNVLATKDLIPDFMPSESVAVVRLVGGAILFWVTSLFIKCEPIQKKDWLRIILGGVVGLFGFIYSFVIALRYGSAINIAIIMTLPPMFVILINILFQHLRPSLTEYAGVLISFASAVIIILSGADNHDYASSSMLGNFLAIFSAFCYALYLVIVERPSKTYSPLSLLRWVFLFGALPALFLLPDLQNMPILHTSQQTPWVEIIFILLCPTYFAYFLIQPAIVRIGSGLVSLYQYLIPVVATVAAVMMGRETLYWSQVFAMAVIVIGMLITNLGKKKRINVLKKYSSHLLSKTLPF